MICEICENKTDIKLFLSAQKNHPDLYLCKYCKLVFASPQCDKDLESVSIKPLSYSEYRARVKNFDLRYNKITNFLFSYKSKNILDIGCGDGIFLKNMKSKGFNVIGIEPSLDSSEYIKNNFKIDVINDIFENVNFSDKFSIITMFNVLEHSKSLNASLSKVHNLLEPKGLFVFEVPYIFTLQSKLSLGYWHHFELDHNWFLNKTNIKILSENNGFEVLNITFIPKIVCLSKIFDCLLTRTIYMHISRNSYMKLRRTIFYKIMNKFYFKINIKDYLFVILKKF